MIYKATKAEASTIAGLAILMWTEPTIEELTKDFEALLCNDETAIFLLTIENEAAGFAQCQLRHDYVEGTESRPVGYLEGILVKDLIVEKFKELGYKTEYKILNAADYGVPQIRQRVILIGIRKDINIEPEEVYSRILKTNSDNPNNELPPYITVREAISDLPSIQAGEGSNMWTFAEYQTMNNYVKKIRNTNFPFIYNHKARMHNEKDKERYKILDINS